MAHDVFISYSSKDKTVADAVVSTLENENIRCWYAPRDIQPGADWGESITEGIHDCRVFLLIFSQNSNQSKRVLDEVYYAISEEKTIIPFRIENLVPTGAMSLHLSSKHWLNAYHPSWSSHLSHLSNSLKRNLGREVTIEDEMEESPQFPLAREEAPAKKHWPLPIWATAGLILIAVVIVSGVGWFAFSQPQTTPTPSEIPSTEIAIVSKPTDTPVPDTPTIAPTEIPSSVFQDDFDNALAEGWNILREVPSRWSLTDNPGSWRVTLTPGTVDGFIPEFPTNVLLREAPNGDFEIATLVNFTPTNNYQFAGLFVYQDDQNVVQLGRSFCDRADICVGNGIYFDSIGNVIDNISKVTSNPSLAYLRLRREGTIYTGYYSEDGESWTTIGQHVSNINPAQVGLMAGQALEVETIADFEYFTMEELSSISSGWSEWRTLSFNIQNENFWRQSESSYTTIADPDPDTFAWSDEIVEGDLILTAEVTSALPSGSGTFIVYGDGAGFSHGCLIFHYGHGYAMITKHSIYHEGENWLVVNPGDFNFEEQTHIFRIEIVEDKASFYVDDQKVAFAFLSEEISRRGRIGLTQHWEEVADFSSVTYSNIRIKTLGNGE